MRIKAYVKWFFNQRGHAPATEKVLPEKRQGGENFLLLGTYSLTKKAKNEK